MSYTLYITRRQDRFAEDQPAITVEAWLAACKQVPALRPVSGYSVGDIEINYPPEWHAHAWFGHPRGPDKQGPVFQLVDGNLDFYNADPPTLSLALRLAGL